MEKEYQAQPGVPVPPPELVRQLRAEAPHGIRDAGVTRELHLINAAYRAGADQELEACCEWLDDDDDRATLRAARRPKPPSLKEQALAVLMNADGADHPVPVLVLPVDKAAIIRRAIEALPDIP